MQVAVKVAAPNHPLTLVLKPNNTLDPGSGMYLVEGRRITGKNSNDDFTFAPLNSTCNLAVLSPGEVPSVAVATGTSPVPAGDAVLTILSGLPAPPGTPNALASYPYVLLREDVATIIANPASPFRLVCLPRKSWEPRVRIARPIARQFRTR